MTILKNIGYFLISGIVWFVIFICPVNSNRDVFGAIKILIHSSEQFAIEHPKASYDREARDEYRRKKILESFSSQFTDDRR